MNRILSLLFIASVLLPQSISAEFSFSGDLGIQAARVLGDQHKEKTTFDALWGRFNLKAAFKGESGFSAFVYLRIYPAGYGGLEYVKEVSFGDDEVTGSSKLAAGSKMQVIIAAATYKWENFNVSAGRLAEKFNDGTFFGDYIQRPATKATSFKYPGALHNGIKMIANANMFSALILLGAGDGNLNSGYLIGRLALKPTDILNFYLNYQGNLFDGMQNSDADISSNMAVGAKFTYLKKEKIYFEVGFQNMGKENDTVAVPFMFGVSIPTGPVLDALVAEIQYSSDRDDAGLQPFQWGVLLAKSFGKYAKFETGFHSNVGGTEGSDVTWAIRWTAGLK